MGEPLDIAALARSLTEITRRHEAWRTVFATVDGAPVQQIQQPEPFDLQVVDLTGLPPPQREAEALRLAVAEARRPFDLRRGPLVRGLLARLDDTVARLIVTAHHSVVDGVSFFNIFLPELRALYVAYSNGQPSPLPELPVQYADFAVWQRRWLTEEELRPKLAYWRAHLADMTELCLPTDYPRPSEMRDHGARAPIALPAELTTRLREIGRRAGVTLFTTLLAAWKTLLFRYTGQGDIVVGSAAAGRARPELDRLIGFFNNNLVLRTRFDGSLTFVELLGRVGEVLRAAREHQDVPFDRLLTELKAERSLNKNPIYNNVFILMPPLVPPSEPPDWSASRFDIGTAKVDLYLELHQRPSGLVGHIEYQTELFSAATVDRMIGHFQTLLEGIARDPEQRLSDLPLLSAAEAQQIATWQGVAAAPLPESEILSLERLFEAQAARSPTAIAVLYGDERLTYEELNRRANRLARWLRSEGVGPDSMVGLCVKRGLDAMIGILGVLKAGGAYVPLDPEYPAERLRFLMDDAGIKLVLTDGKSARAVPPHRGRTVLLDEGWASIAQHSDTDLAPVAGAGDLAYVLYTSGSTGRPKGVLVERRGLYHLARAQERMFGLGEGSRVLQFFSLNFDVSVWELSIAWPVGATLVLADPIELLPGPGLARLLKEKEIHVAAMTPSALAVTPFHELPALHTIITAGEALPEELVKRWAPGRRFFNGYGPTETTVVSVIAECSVGEGKPPIGRPLSFVQVHLLDNAMRAVPIGVPGELYIGGPGVARGYLNRPDLTAERFLDSPLSEAGGTRLYRTGDRVKWRPDGTLDYLGRTDRQVKVRGFRIELGEIEAEIGRHPAVQAATVEVFEVAGDKRLIAYVVPRADAPPELEQALKKHLRDRVPEHMVPAAFVALERMPVSSSGKVDRARLPAPRSPVRSVALSRTSLEQDILSIWREVLGVEGVNIDAPFFEIGGHSLALARVQAKLAERLGAEVDVLTLMRLTTVRQLSAHLANAPGLERASVLPDRVERTEGAEAPSPPPERPRAIAIVGMAIRAPGAHGPEELWEVIRAGRETIRALTPQALIAAGADPARVGDPAFVPAEGVLTDADRFDAGFFGYSEADATLMDPQHRLFLESAHEALEHAGCDPARFPGRIGVFGGAGAPLYWLGPVADSLRASGSHQDAYRARTLNAPDFLTLRVAFKLGLRGPAVTVQTGCSTSLVAVHTARQSLLTGECDVALAGGVTLSTLREADLGYHYDGEGAHESADGHCRPFDADASGMVKSSGVAIVAMKRLSDALADGDTIHAIVLGSAMNNDGAGKMGFTAPSEDGQVDAIQRAYEAAGVDPGSVQFIEAHGTGTRLGDPIEVRALTRAFRRWTDRRGFCALGSLKANVGHLDSAASAASLIKAALTLAHELVPPVVGFRSPNPLLDLPGTPFVVSAVAQPWPRTKSPRRAGVNALGIGGANVHVVLEEAPLAEAPAATRPFQLLCLSARTDAALAEVARRLCAHLASHPSVAIADAAHTLSLGRAQQRCRATIVCQDVSEARGALASGVTSVLSAASPTAESARPVVFLLPGHGAQYLQMGLGVYDTEPVFRAEIDRCFSIMDEDAGLDLRSLWFDRAPESDRRLDEMQWAQPLLFTIEYALAKQLMAWGARPSAMLGHSLGEYVAACLAGVLSLRDALALVATRGRLMDATPPGAMLAVFADQRTIEPHLDADVVIATYAPGSVVLSGPSRGIEGSRVRLTKAGIETSGVRVSRASHSPVMRAIRDAFRRRVAEAELRPPAIPIVSNVTGRYLTDEQATSPDYWADHLCSPVRLTDGLGALLDLESPVCIELGPGSSLGSFLKGHPRYASRTADVVGTLPDFRRRAEPSCAALLRGLGRMWELGMDVDWKAFYAHEKRRRIPLPTYPFEGRRYMLGAAPAEHPVTLDARALILAREIGVRAVDDYPGLRSRLDALCASLVLDFFARRLGDGIGGAHSMDALQRATGILPSFSRMLHILLETLEEAGLASRTADGEILLRAPHVGRAAELSARLLLDFPAASGLVRLVEHFARHYDEALTGAMDPIAVLCPDGTNAFFLACMNEMGPPEWQVYVALAHEAVLDIVDRRRGQKLRVLEVGAGHGSLTWPLLERLRGADVEYHFTDVGRSFLLSAEEEAERRGLSGVKVLRFDLNRPPQEQGIDGHYDVILGLDSVHTALDLPVTLQNLHGMLVTGGALIFIELTRVETWHNLTAGLLPVYGDTTNARGVLWLDLARWEEALRRSGFARVTTVPRGEAARDVAEYGLLIAERGLAEQRSERHIARVKPLPIRFAERLSAAPDGHSSDAAADDAERIVRTLWRRLLGVANVPAGASFFELGGDSLLVVQFLAELRLQTGRDIKTQQFNAHATVEGVAGILRSFAQPRPTIHPGSPSGRATIHPGSPSGRATIHPGSPSGRATIHPGPSFGRATIHPGSSFGRATIHPGPSFGRATIHPGPLSGGASVPPTYQVPKVTSAEVAHTASAAADGLVPLQQAGSKRPFFCVHPIGGDALCYAPLAKALDPDRPFFGIQSPMLGDPSARPGSVEEMAARYVDAMQRAQPSGPYLLGGWSFGGVVAAEMVRQLRLRGEDVAQLVLFDALASPSAGTELLRHLDERLPALAMLSGMFAGSRREAGDRGRSRSDSVSQLSGDLVAAARNLAICDHHLAIWRRHRPSELDVPAIHFVPKGKTLLGALLLAGRRRGLPLRRVEAVEVSGDHFSMLSGDRVRGFTARLRSALDAASPGDRARSDGSSQEADEESVRAFLDQFVDWMWQRDADSLGGMFAEGIDCVSVSSGETIFVGSEQMKKHYKRKMASLEELRVDVHTWRILILAGGRIACAVGQLDSDQTFVEGARDVSYRDTRVSIVLEKQDGAWRVVHSHYSLPVGGAVDMMA